MDFIDYREKLGIGFSDKRKAQLFITKLFIYIDASSADPKNTYRDLNAVSFDDYIRFCTETGTETITLRAHDNYNYERYLDCIRIIKLHSDDLLDFLSYFVTFANCKNSKSRIGLTKIELIGFAERALRESHIQYTLVEDEGDFFIFPKGVPELDDALVSEVLDWLHEYPVAEKAWQKALKSYADATDENASDIADSFRKALETFFQEFFDSNKALEHLKSEYGTYMKKHNVPAEISNNFETLMQLYTNFMNSYAKHHDLTSDSLLEYIMYQTGNTMRLLITLKGTDE